MQDVHFLSIRCWYILGPFRRQEALAVRSYFRSRHNPNRPKTLQWRPLAPSLSISPAVNVHGAESMAIRATAARC
ncbi:hypothetical protein BC936DRAFT_147761 [Jimgerdemannia flammicorona]|uniref:Uncharacterized protein n=1 Tax=Jimgerdemannia flammicorona TaxID=994334 RepID=A0A433D4I4_9FUNG|nr:hypothetical protein BC936DRAFT_147761 [Jimgerdemannia flammicorona]